MNKGELTFDERQAVENVLGLSSGYVLDFSNRTFREFFGELGIEVNQEQSKAKWLRQFLAGASRHDVRLVLGALLKHRDFQGGDTLSPYYKAYQAILERLESTENPVPPLKSSETLNLHEVGQLSQKAIQRLSDGDFSGAITAARTLVESTLVAIELEISGKRGDYKGKLPLQFKTVCKMLSIDAHNPNFAPSVRQIARGLADIVSGLAALRNAASDSRAITFRPERRHAELAVASANTLASFLISVHAFKGSASYEGTPTGDEA